MMREIPSSKASTAARRFAGVVGVVAAFTPEDEPPVVTPAPPATPVLEFTASSTGAMTRMALVMFGLGIALLLASRPKANTAQWKRR